MQLQSAVPRDQDPNAPPARRVLVVRHGRGRGRLKGYMDHVLAGILASAPARDARIRLHETGSPGPRLDDVAAVVFWLADPLREWYPACYAEAVSIAAAARARGIALVNPPESLSNSVKSRQSALWRAAGVDTPPHRRFESLDQLPGLAREIGFPLLIRSDEHHTQAGMKVLRDEQALAAVRTQELVLPGTAAPLWDTRESWRREHPRSPFARLHHKKRAYVLRDRVRNEHVFFSTDPVVSSTTCTFARFQRRPAWLHGLSRILPRERAAIREDLAYWSREQDHAAELVGAARILGFDFAAIDFSERADGSLMMWEANPYPFLPSVDRMLLPRQRRAEERMESYRRSIREFLLGWLETEDRAR